MVAGMSDEPVEPGNLTERFRTFARSADPEPSRFPQILLIAAAVALLVAFVAVAIIVFA
jgi:hypothetical protein